MWTFFAKRRRKRRRGPDRRLKPELTVAQILAWADAQRRYTGAWPTACSGRIHGTAETWMAVNSALKIGLRGLPGGTTLPRLLAAERGHRNIGQLPQLTVPQILAWADAYHARHGRWPQRGADPAAPGVADTWQHIHSALQVGLRGLPGGASLARLLERERGVRNGRHLPRLRLRQILAWADAHQRATGRWPTERSGEIAAAPETWSAVDAALREGARGLPGGSSLAQLLAEQRGVRNSAQLPPYSLATILAWADDHRRRTGQWPYSFSGAVAAAPGETWRAVDAALRIGRRGLPGGSSLTQLLAQERGMRNQLHPPPLTEAQLLAWADAHQARTGRWPTARTGPVEEAPGEHWRTLDWLLQQGQRGLPGGRSLAQLLLEQRGVRTQSKAPPLTVAQILAWADAHRARRGRWPTATAGAIVEAPGETWSAVDKALNGGLRGLPQVTSIARLVAEHRGVRLLRDQPRLTARQILRWADAHHRRTGRWPTPLAGAVAEAPGETWRKLDRALRAGRRGLDPDQSLYRLLRQTGRG